MRRLRPVTLAIIAASFAIGFFCARLSFQFKSQKENDTWVGLNRDVITLINAAKNSLAKGEGFKTMVNDVVISGNKMVIFNQTNINQEQLNYILIVHNWQNNDFAGLNGLLTLRKNDSRHVDVMFRQGFAQIGFSDIAICVDDYDLESIKWKTETNSLDQLIESLAPQRQP